MYPNLLSAQRSAVALATQVCWIIISVAKLFDILYILKQVASSQCYLISKKVGTRLAGEICDKKTNLYVIICHQLLIRCRSWYHLTVTVIIISSVESMHTIANCNKLLPRQVVKKMLGFVFREVSFVFVPHYSF